MTGQPPRWRRLLRLFAFRPVPYRVTLIGAGTGTAVLLAAHFAAGLALIPWIAVVPLVGRELAHAIYNPRHPETVSD